MDALNLLNKNKNKIINISVIVVALFIASKIYKQQSQQEQVMKDRNEVEIKKNSELQSIEKEGEKIDAYRDLLVNKDPNSSINEITGMAKELGIKVQSIKPLDTINNPDYTKALFELTIKSPSYHALGEFISTIESSVNVYMIESLKIMPDHDTRNRELSVNLIISIVAAN